MVCLYSLAAQRPVPAPAQAAAPSPAPSLVAPPPQTRSTPPQRPSATGITLELLKTRGLAGLYRGAGATLMRLTHRKIPVTSPIYNMLNIKSTFSLNQNFACIYLTSCR